MLKEFTIKNFTSFNDETLFSMQADTERVSEHPDHVVNINGNDLLKVASVYGPNGGGKTNLLNALSLAKMVQRNEGFADTYQFPCVFSNSNEIEETVFFVDEKYEMGYRFCIKPALQTDDEFDEEMTFKSRMNRQSFEIVAEEVSYRRAGSGDYKSLFERNDSGVVQSGVFDELINRNSELRLAKTKSVIRYLFDTFANNDGELSEGLDVIRRLYGQINGIIMLENRLSFFFTGSGAADVVKNQQKELTQILNGLDINVKEIRYYDKRRYPVYFVREYECNGKKTEKELSFYMESDGTQKIFWMLVSILKNMKEGKIFYCNDMNAYLHPKLFREVVKLFQSNKYNSQLIFNSHDLINMDNELFRRDEIWFAYKDDGFSTQLVPLSNIVNYKGEQVRKDAKFYKQYLEGKYGADPFIKKGLNWNV